MKNGFAIEAKAVAKQWYRSADNYRKSKRSAQGALQANMSPRGSPRTPDAQRGKYPLALGGQRTPLKAGTGTQSQTRRGYGQRAGVYPPLRDLKVDLPQTERRAVPKVLGISEADMRGPWWRGTPSQTSAEPDSKQPLWCHSCGNTGAGTETESPIAPLTRRPWGRGRLSGRQRCRLIWRLTWQLCRHRCRPLYCRLRCGQCGKQLHDRLRGLRLCGTGRRLPLFDGSHRALALGDGSWRRRGLACGS